MEESLKARLIGAAVLVALAVLLIPELLSGRKAVEPVTEEGTGPRGTRTFTIELGQGPGQATSSQPTAAAMLARDSRKRGRKAPHPTMLPSSRMQEDHQLSNAIVRSKAAGYGETPHVS